MPRVALASVSAPTVGKCVLRVKQQDSDCCSQSGNLKIRVDLALCGFISCPETELRAAGGPEMTNISKALVQHGFLCSEMLGNTPGPLLCAGSSTEPFTLDDLLLDETSVKCMKPGVSVLGGARGQ